MDQPDSSPHFLRGRIRSKKPGFVFFEPSPDGYARELVLDVNTNTYKRFVVFQPDVVPWRVLFYEGIFEQKRFFFVVGKDVIEICRP